jgi:hypothetical protein
VLPDPGRRNQDARAHEPFRLASLVDRRWMKIITTLFLFVAGVTAVAGPLMPTIARTPFGRGPDVSEPIAARA